MNNTKIVKTIYELENKLLQPEIRNSPEQVARLLSKDFVEYCSPGSIYKYKAKDFSRRKALISGYMTFRLEY